MGIGLKNDINSTKCVIKPSHLFDEECLVLTRGRVDLVSMAEPRETDDQLFVWLHQYKVFCCGNDYYHSFPNLYAIRVGNIGI